MIKYVLLILSAALLGMYISTVQPIYCILTSIFLALSWVNVAREKLSDVDIKNTEEKMYGKSPDYIPYFPREAHEDFSMAVMNEINDI